MKEQINTVANWNKWFWEELNPLCIRCIHNCKQSAKVKIIACKKFKSKDYDYNEKKNSRY